MRSGSSYGRPAAVAVVGVFSFFSVSPRFLLAHPTEQAPERGRRPKNEEQNVKIPPAQQAKDLMQCVHDCACTPASHTSSNAVFRSLRAPAPLKPLGCLRVNVAGVSDPKGYTPLIRKAKIIRLRGKSRQQITLGQIIELGLDESA